MEPIKIFIVTHPVQKIPEIVLRYSIDRRTTAHHAIHYIRNDQRFDVPSLCGYKGRAIVIDAASVCLENIADLANVPTRYISIVKSALGVATNVMVMNCEALKNIALVPTLLSVDVSPLDPMWNQIDQYPLGTKIINYADTMKQPWFVKPITPHPFASVFMKELRSALDNGVILKETVLDEEKKKHAYPGLLKDALSA